MVHVDEATHPLPGPGEASTSFKLKKTPLILLSMIYKPVPAVSALIAAPPSAMANALVMVRISPPSPFLKLIVTVVEVASGNKTRPTQNLMAVLLSIFLRFDTVIVLLFILTTGN